MYIAPLSGGFFFFLSVRGYGKLQMSGKSRGILRWMISGNPGEGNPDQGKKS